MWAFEKKGGEYVPKFPLELSSDDTKKLESLLEALDEHDDVQEVYTNSVML